MNIYQVNFKLVGAGWSDGDEVVSGGAYDIHEVAFITCSSKERAKAAILKTNSDNSIKIKSIRLLGKA